MSTKQKIILRRYRDGDSERKISRELKINTEFHGNSKHVVFKNRKLLQKQFSYSRATSIFDWDTS